MLKIILLLYFIFADKELTSCLNKCVPYQWFGF